MSRDCIGVISRKLKTKGKHLEEMDELFAMKLWPWQWSKTQTQTHRQYLVDIEARQNGLEVQDIKEKDTGVTEHVSCLCHRAS